MDEIKVEKITCPRLNQYHSTSHFEILLMFRLRSELRNSSEEDNSVPHFDYVPEKIMCEEYEFKGNITGNNKFPRCNFNKKGCIFSEWKNFFSSEE